MSGPEPVTPRRILITGATGFIGTHAVAAAVERGHEVHGLARHHPRHPVRGVEYHSVDLLDEPEKARHLLTAVRPSHLLHLAWYAEPGLYWTSPLNFRWVAASLELAAAFAAAGGSRFVGTGSCAEYESTDRALSEAAPVHPATPYGICKSSLSDLLQRWSSLAGVSMAWARIFFLYGPGEPPGRLVSSICSALLRGERVATSEGNQKRDFLFAADVGSALITLTESNVAGAVNIGSGHAVAVRDIATEIGRQAGRPDLLDFGGLPSRDEPALVEADITRLRTDVGWQPACDLTTGISRTIDWWRARNR